MAGFYEAVLATDPGYAFRNEITGRRQADGKVEAENEATRALHRRLQHAFEGTNYLFALAPEEAGPGEKQYVVSNIAPVSRWRTRGDQISIANVGVFPIHAQHYVALTAIEGGHSFCPVSFTARSLEVLRSHRESLRRVAMDHGGMEAFGRKFLHLPEIRLGINRLSGKVWTFHGDFLNNDVDVLGWRAGTVQDVIGKICALPVGKPVDARSDALGFRLDREFMAPHFSQLPAEAPRAAGVRSRLMTVLTAGFGRVWAPHRS
jgi:hypothetical protein